MNDRWAKYNRRLDEEFKPLMKVLSITIYGSYYPEPEKDFLKNQRDYLISKGYSEASLVEDYPEQESDISNLEKSIRCLQYSDVNFLIFTREGKRYGVSRELTHIATSPTMIDKVRYCTVFEQMQDDRGSIPPLSIDDINNSGIGRREFTSELQLQKALSQQTYIQLRSLRNVLLKRI